MAVTTLLCLLDMSGNVIFDTVWVRVVLPESDTVSQVLLMVSALSALAVVGIVVIVLSKNR